MHVIMRALVFATFVAAIVSSSWAKTTLVERGAGEWKYHDTGGSPGENWLAAEFDDSAWKSGKAPLGYGEEDIATKLSFGEDEFDKHPAAFFRRTIRIPDEGAGFAKLKASIRCDDGAAFYLNGKSIGRYNLGSDPVTHETHARRTVGGSLEGQFAAFDIPGDQLKPGKNILAISVHQVSATSSDLVLDMEIVGLTADELPKPARLRAEAKPAVDAYHQQHFVKPEMRIPDGYVDGGTYMKIKEDGSIVATREVITVDRERDAKLRDHIKFAESTREMELVERATRIAKYVDDLTSPEGGRKFAEAATRKLQDYRNAEILLGEVPEYCGGGVCRHRSLLFKILGDEAGLNVGLRRGHIVERGRIVGRHAWNEITLGDGSIRIVDVMNPEKDFIFPEPETISHKYGDIKGKPLYEKKSPKTEDPTPGKKEQVEPPEAVEEKPAEKKAA